MKISVFGLGYVGAVSCGCLAKLGHEVVGVDVNEEKVKRMSDGIPPVMEPQLAELIQEACQTGKICSTLDATEAVHNTDIALVCVGTPSTPSGKINSTYLEQAIAQIGEALKEGSQGFFTLLNRSTSLVPIHRKVQDILQSTSGRTIGETAGYACHPEFLREGVAVDDFFNPPKIVFGVSDETTQRICKNLYPNIDAPEFFVSPETASMIKYADNCFHAVKVTFANEIGMMCQQLGVDAQAVMDVFCADTKLNISKRYLRPGTPFGGSCLPKDLRALLDTARETANPLPMLSGTLKSNSLQLERLARRIISPQRPTVGIVGLAFKEKTDDVRESPMISLVELLCGKGHTVRIFDEHLAAEALMGANRSFALMSIPHLAELLINDLQNVVDNSDIVVVSHRLNPDAWKKTKSTLRNCKRIIDLVNIPELKCLPNYEGLYWP